jgi:hypothetical protein
VDVLNLLGGFSYEEAIELPLGFECVTQPVATGRDRTGLRRIPRIKDFGGTDPVDRRSPAFPRVPLGS